MAEVASAAFCGRHSQSTKTFLILMRGRLLLPSGIDSCLGRLQWYGYCRDYQFRNAPWHPLLPCCEPSLLLENCGLQRAGGGTRTKRISCQLAVWWKREHHSPPVRGKRQWQDRQAYLLASVRTTVKLDVDMNEASVLLGSNHSSLDQT